MTREQGLVLCASQHPSGKIVEPVTGEVFEWDELKKVRSTDETLAFWETVLTTLPRSRVVQVFIS